MGLEPGMHLHATAVAREGQGVLLLAPPGGGKSDLALRLVSRGWMLVADDQVALARQGAGLCAAPPPALAGRLEVRGLGLVERLAWAPAPLALAVDLVTREAVPRLPAPARWEALGAALPLLRLDGRAASAPEVLGLALDALAGRCALTAGAFAA